jgi:glucoamylase
LSGERGEYEVARGGDGLPFLQTMANTANDGFMIPEQVWDLQPPAGTNGFVPGRPTFSATPLAWTHAQYLRLVRDVQVGRVSEQPAVVAQRYAGTGGG